MGEGGVFIGERNCGGDRRREVEEVVEERERKVETGKRWWKLTK